jgi:hypothetical protein
LIFDPDHSENGYNIGIISARKSTKKEEKQYREFLNIREEYDFSNSIRNPYVKKEKNRFLLI